MGGGLGGASDHAVEAPVGVHPLDLISQHQQSTDGRGVVGLVLAGVINGSLQVQESRDEAVGRIDLLNTLDGSRRHCSQPDAAVRSETLLRGEVVDVSLGHVDREAAGAGGGVDSHELALGACRAGDRNHGAGGGLVVSPTNKVNALFASDNLRCGTRLCFDDLRSVEPRSHLGGLGELGGELTVSQVSGLLLDEPKGGSIPESGCAAEGQDNLVAFRKLEELSQTLANLTNNVLHCRLTVGGTHDRGTAVNDCLNLRRANLRWTAAKAAVAGLELFREDWELIAHMRRNLSKCIQSEA